MLSQKQHISKFLLCTRRIHRTSAPFVLTSSLSQELHFYSTTISPMNNMNMNPNHNDTPPTTTTTKINDDESSSTIVHDYHHPMDTEQFRKHGHDMIDFICDYMNSGTKQLPQQQHTSSSSYPVLSQQKPGYLHEQLPSKPPLEPTDFSHIMNDVHRLIMPGVTHWQHPNYFAYFSANTSFPSILGDMLSSTLNVIGFNWMASPAATELETVVMDWLAHALELPSFYYSVGKGGGCIQGSASEAVIVCMLAAKARATQQYLTHHMATTVVSEEVKSGSSGDGADQTTLKTQQQKQQLLNELQGKMTVYMSDQTHSSVKKACMVIGISDDRVRVIESNSLYEMDAEKLRETIKSDIKQGLIPIFVAATKGTTSSTAFDDLTKIGPICEELSVDDVKIWLHVDAAFAGSSFICPEYREMYMKGIEHTHSFNFNPHKWMLTNFDCSALWVHDRKHLIDALSVTPEYLRNKASESGLVIDYRDWQVPLGRRFRSLKLWFVIRSYGITGLQNYVRHHIQLAELFEQWVSNSDLFEMLVPRTISLICFRIKPSVIEARIQNKKTPNELNTMLLERVNETGKIFITHTMLRKDYALRLAICGYNTQERNIQIAWQVLNEQAESLLRELA